MFDAYMVPGKVQGTPVEKEVSTAWLMVESTPVELQ